MSETLIEYQGDFYTPEEFAEKLKEIGKFKIKVNSEDETWFGEAMKNLEDK
jgi:uncharacterized Fe-S cluster-containing radical SAM superfamily protein